MGIKDGSVWPKIATIVLLVAFLLYLISFGAPHWSKSKDTSRDEHIGLWRYCVYPYGGGQSCNDFIDIITGDWLKAAQAVETLALFSFLGAIACIAIYAFVPDFEKDMRIMGASLALIGLTGLFLITGIGVWAGKHHEYYEQKEIGIWTKENAELYWAFGINCCSCILTFASLVLLVLDLIVGDEGY